MRLVALASAALLALASGCAPRGALTVYPDAAKIGAIEPIFVATSRGVETGPNVFSGDRSEALNFARFLVSVPPEREPGTVTFPDQLPPDPATDFLTVSGQLFRDVRSFQQAVDAGFTGGSIAEREVAVFVHGFNTNFSEGLYRQAQMTHDFQGPGVSVNYSWPSAGNVRAYPYDRESALFARDGLRQTLIALSRTRASRLVVVGHSMGAMVLMEALRDMSWDDSPLFFDKLHAVVLMAPDLDIEVFRTQLQPLARREVPIYVFFSTRDRALRASSFIRGQNERLGSIRDTTRFADLPITFINTSSIAGEQDPLGHFTVATSPTMIALIQGMDDIGTEILADEARSTNLFETSVNVVQGVTEVVLEPLAQ